MATMNKLRAEMAQRFLDALNQGQLPWRACWQQGRPVNAVTGKLYKGVNAFWLSYMADQKGYTDPRWCTYCKAEEKGWQVRKGEKACRVEYWAYYDPKKKKLLSWDEAYKLIKAEPEYAKKLQLRCRIFSVFNAEQIDGIPELQLQQNHTDIGALRQQRDTLLHNMAIGYEEHGDRAYYSPFTDTVTLPPEGSFDDPYAYMCTFLHECGHGTGHASRLNRDLSGMRGSESYAREELRAEIASAFTAQALGLQLTDAQLRMHMNLHTAYIQGWAAHLKDAPEELFRAIKAAEEISDYLIEKGEFDMTQNQQEPERKEWHIVYESNDPLDEKLVIVPAEELQGREVVQTLRCTNLQEATEKLQRYEELQQYFWDETDDPESQEWREELTADEAAMVEQWDKQTARGFSRLASAILERSAPTEQIMVAIESTDDYTDANFYQELTDIDKQNPDGSWGTVVDQYRIVKIGDSGRIEALDNDLIFPTKAQAEAVAAAIPYVTLVPYDEIVHQVAMLPKVKYTLSAHPDAHGMLLRIHGQGAIPDFIDTAARPFQSHAEQIREVVIEEGITAIGKRALSDLPALEKIRWPRTIQRVEPLALDNCPGIKEIEYYGEPVQGTEKRELIAHSELMDLSEKYPDMTREQLVEIANGIQDALTPEQISTYAKKQYSPIQMNAIRYSIASGLAPDQIDLLANPAFDSVQMDIIRSSFQTGLTMEQVKIFAKPEIPAQQMLNAYWAVREGRSWEPPQEQVYGYDIESWNRMSEGEQENVMTRCEYDLQHPDQADWGIEESY